MTKFIMDVENQVKIFTTGNLCTNWVITWPCEHGHSWTTKGLTNLSLADLVKKGWKISFAENQTCILKSVACSQEIVWLSGIPSPRSLPSRCGRGLMLWHTWFVLVFKARNFKSLHRPLHSHAFKSRCLCIPADCKIKLLLHRCSYGKLTSTWKIYCLLSCIWNYGTCKVP